MKLNEIDFIATGKHLRRMMREKNVTVSFMAETLGISIQAVYKYFNGTCLPAEKLFQIAQILDVNAEDIVRFKPMAEIC